MNNEQFRRLILQNSARKDGVSSQPSAMPVLGARRSMLMTPRQAGGSSTNADFARQLAERNTKVNPVKRFKSSAPKGVKLAPGYTDRTKHPVDDESDEKAQRIKALEEAMKLGQIDRTVFEQLVGEITGGDISSTHLVKGLDRKLLERVKRGENVLNSATPKDDYDVSLDAEDEFDQFEQQEVAPIVREKAEKKGEAAPPPPVVGQKRTRDAILAELKAQRKDAAEAATAEHERRYQALGKGFRKIGDHGETSWLETDKNGREVLVIRDADGKEKRKVKKRKVEEQPIEHEKLEMLDGDQKALNLHNIPAPPPPAEAEEDEDIFEGVGSNYNPLVGLEDEADSDDEKAQADPFESAEEGANHEEGGENEERETLGQAPLGSGSEEPAIPLSRRNYFKATPSISEIAFAPPADATVLAALRKVRQMDTDSTLFHTEEQIHLKKRATLLAAVDRDMEDLDMGFGASRDDDAEEMEMEGERVKFSEWKGLGAEGEDEEDGGIGKGGKKRKRGPKKKKGDKNNAVDVLKVMERQKKTKTLG
ncbi:uncharacterized protein BDR25DRAFT_338538 [Lindgomyces ingoldianus]|uniref:Uncharacterized protein n=1 Tax=Lindgomyces ingoldianus TaxID=673940 RepID=A0ACB6RES5_9PLEO|nr:uncharacterized protein BDR25DRAFT_338538 [Lindgomyces ingoldianus]KAF2477793.1 hypothetical protein BDR25DRAFT_338538 [Lindgomyces ingoldianus]